MKYKYHTLASALTSFNVLMLGMVVSGPVAAAYNNAPPSGAILDLNGQSINHSTAVQESVSFTAGLANTEITLAMREDPAFILLSNVSLIDNTTSSSNLLTNGNFSGGTYSVSGNNIPNGWTYANMYAATYSGSVGSLNCNGAAVWCDGSVQAYDSIAQMVTTRNGDNYTLSFYYTDNGTLSTFSSLSTNGQTGYNNTGGNGVDILAYAQATNPIAPVPEPETYAMLLAGFGLVGFLAFRRKDDSSDMTMAA